MQRSNEPIRSDCISDALLELKELQDFIIHSRTKYFGKLIGKLIGVDTIPFFLQTNNGRMEIMGVDVNPRTNRDEWFLTEYFRVEEVDEESCSATVSLLRPLNVHGDSANLMCDVMVLKRTSVCVHVDLSSIRSIQPLDADLLKRKIIIEPKW